MDETQLADALAQPAGARADLLPAALTACFGNRWPRRESQEDLERSLRHLTGGKSWAHEAMVQKQSSSSFERLFALGFADAEWADVETFIGLNSISAARVLHARNGRDPVDVLLALSKRSAPAPVTPHVPGTARVQHAALAAAIVASPRPVAAGLEAELLLGEITWAPLAQAALEALGSERASAVALRTLRAYAPDEPAAYQSLAPVLECFSAQFNDAVLEELTLRFGTSTKAAHWEGLGDRLARASTPAALAFLQKFEGRHPGFRWAIRGLLATNVGLGRPLAPEHDQYVDPAEAAQQGTDTWRVTNKLLEAMGPARAEVCLSSATFAKPGDLLRFVVPGSTEATLKRLAEAHVASREDPDAEDLLISTKLRGLGPTFAAAMQAALAEVTPKKDYVAVLKRNLDPAVFAEVSKWLADRPAPPKPAKKPKQGKG